MTRQNLLPGGEVAALSSAPTAHFTSEPVHTCRDSPRHYQRPSATPFASPLPPGGPSLVVKAFPPLSGLASPHLVASSLLPPVYSCGVLRPFTS
eukprot:scaffold3056_cov56-Isochrysis_galbana.AAC.2